MILPNSSFLHPRKRLFPYKDSGGRINSRLVENAIADIVTSQLPVPVKANLMTRARAIAKRTTEAELWKYIQPPEPKPKESDMGTIAYKRISESLSVVLQLELLRLQTSVARRRLSAIPAREPVAPVEEPVAESMMESYALPAEALSEVAALEQGDERVIRNCTFIKSGLNSPKTRRWDAGLLEESIECFQDSLCFIDHPSEGAARSLRSLAGHTRNARFDEATKSVVGDIVLLSDNEAADYVVSLFSNETIRNSQAVGLSVLWEGGSFDADFEDVGGKTIQVPRELKGKCQCDFVANPSAGGRVGLLS